MGQQLRLLDPVLDALRESTACAAVFVAVRDGTTSELREHLGGALSPPDLAEELCRGGVEMADGS